MRLAPFRSIRRIPSIGDGEILRTLVCRRILFGGPGLVSGRRLAARLGLFRSDVAIKGLSVNGGLWMLRFGAHWCDGTASIRRF